jgi:hypothetical protein
MPLRSLIAIAIVVVAGWVVLRQRTLRQLQVEQAQLQVQAAEARKLRAELEQVKPATQVAAESPLSAAERAELLRLRGEVSRLRRDLTQPTNRTARAARPPRPQATTPADSPAENSETVVTREQMMAKMTSGRQWMLALILHAQDNGGQLPATLADAAKYANGADGADDLELLLTGDLNAVTLPNTAIVLREKQAWKGPRGRWNRTYAFADGHTEIASSDTEDFTAWEERKKNPPPAQP